MGSFLASLTWHPPRPAPTRIVRHYLQVYSGNLPGEYSVTIKVNMASHYSCIGFHLETSEQLISLAQQLSQTAATMRARVGVYRLWSGASGEQMWMQVINPNGRHPELAGMDPHFAGKSALQVSLLSRMHRPHDSVMEGVFGGWVDPLPGKFDDGAYPFVFNAPDFTAYPQIELPVFAQVQVAAFAEEVVYYPSEEMFVNSDSLYAPQSFIPLGLFKSKGDRESPPEPRAFFNGLVKETSVVKNSHTGNPFYWILVETFGGQYDVVADPAMLPEAPRPGGILSGTYWLAGRINLAPKNKIWLGKLFHSGKN